MYDTVKFKISQVSAKTSLSQDTLRYYEKIGLLPKVERDFSGNRQYNHQDISRLNFIKRAQKMDFRLAEIAKLLQMRDDPLRAKEDVRMLTSTKLATIEERLLELTTLRNELRLLINLCRNSSTDCPILQAIDQ